MSNYNCREKLFYNPKWMHYVVCDGSVKGTLVQQKGPIYKLQISNSVVNFDQIYHLFIRTIRSCHRTKERTISLICSLYYLFSFPNVRLYSSCSKKTTLLHYMLIILYLKERRWHSNGTQMVKEIVLS